MYLIISQLIFQFEKIFIKLMFNLIKFLRVAITKLAASNFIILSNCYREQNRMKCLLFVPESAATVNHLSTLRIN